MTEPETFSALADSCLFPSFLSLRYPSVYHESGPAQGFFLFKAAFLGSCTSGRIKKAK